MEEYYGAVDIGGTKITASLANREGIQIRVWQGVELFGDNGTIPRQVDSLIRYCCKESDVDKNGLKKVGIGTCCPFERKNGYKFIVTPNLCGGLSKTGVTAPNYWTEIPLEEVLSKEYKNLKIENDCIGAVVAERLFGAGRGENNLVYVTWSTGVGGGAYVDGVLIGGKNGNALHLGHIYVAEDGPECGCGNYGDLESLTSGIAIARDYGVKRNEAKKVFSAYNARDEKAVSVIKRAVRNFSRGLASVNSLLDTKVFVIGGSVFLENKDILLPLIREEFYKSFPALSRGVDIRKAELDSSLGDLAALSLVMPNEWINEWDLRKPWQHAPDVIKL